MRGATSEPATRLSRKLLVLLLFLPILFALPRPASARTIDLGKSAWRRYPYRATLVRTIPLFDYEEVLVTDLDRNGVSEFLMYPSPIYVLEHGPLRITRYTLRGEQAQTIQQEPIRGVVYPGELREMDVLKDQGNELVITYRRGNQLWCHIWNYQTLTRRDYLLYTHQPPDSTWDPTISPMATLDADFDGNPEILFYVFAGYALMPRGWILLNPRTGKIQQQAFFGSPPDMTWPCLARDFDEDGHLEIVIGTNAPENHFELNGVSDLWSYVLIYDLVTGKREFTRVMGPFYGGTRILGPGPTPDTWIAEYSKLGGNSTNQTGSRLSLFRWKSEVPVREVPLSGRFRSTLGPDYEGDGHGDIYCMLSDKREFWVFSRGLKLLDRVRLKNLAENPHPGQFTLRMVDVNGDDEKEIVLLLGERTYIFDRNLHPLAVVPKSRQLFCGVFQRGTGERPYLVTYDWLRQDLRSAYVWRLEPTPVLARYAPSRRTLYAILGVLILGSIVATYATLRRTRLSNRLLRLSLESAGLQVVAVNGDGRVAPVWGPPLLPIQEGKSLHESCRNKFTESLLRTVDEWQRSGRLSRKQLTLPPMPSGPPLAVDLEVAPKGRQLLLIIRPADEAERGSRRQWQTLAQRLAREIDAPLAAIDQTLEKFSREDQQTDRHASSNSEEARQHAQKVHAAVQRFLKLADPSCRDLQPQDLHVLLKRWSDRRTATLPQKVELVVNIPEGLQRLVADADQIIEALDDLLDNAITAMPEGGLVRVNVRQEHAFRHGGDSEPRDYLVIEVKDSGKGIPPDLLGKIFEPGFTGPTDGAGVGLFVVRKIVEDHGGFVDISSAPGVGTIVSLYFPAGDRVQG